MRLKRFIETGEIVTTHGIKGEVKIYPWSDSAEEVAAYKRLFLDENGEKALEVEKGRVQNGMVLVKFKGIEVPEEAVKLRGKKIYVAREDIKLSPGQLLVCDIIGCEVYDEDDGTLYGTVEDVSKTGSNDVYHVKFADGKVKLVPAIKDVIISSDVEAGIIKIRPLRGLFDED